MSAVRLVSGYIPIPGHWRGPDFYEPLIGRLLDVPLPMTIYRGESLEDTWLWQAIQSLDFAPFADGGHPPKDSIAYHCVTHQKTAWLARAAQKHPDADVLVWVDAGIFQLYGITADGLCRFVEQVDDKAIYAPGLLDKFSVGPGGPCWRFCGSMLSVPHRLAERFDAKCRRIALAQIMASHQVEWEINTWTRAEMEPEDDMPIVWYKADHNGSMLHLLEKK